MLQFYNTLTRRREVFKPIENGTVRLYSCGLTVYDYAHIGNLRAYVFVDLLRRWLEYRGFNVQHVMNLTDVDDKTIRGMKEEGVPLKQYTEKYITAFFEDLELLNIKKAKILPKATEHIEEMVKLIEILLQKGYAYHSDDGSIYYDISKFKNYGELSKMKIEELKAGARVKVDEYGKNEARDFALWRAWDPDDGDVFWETRLGKGRPGWHIECSAMSMKYLGTTMDIHTGGVDNIFPHHENELAQSEAATGERFVNQWLHNEHLVIKGERMGKSLKNFYTLKDLMQKNHDPIAVRFLLLSTYYRKQLHFTFEGLEAAENGLQRLRDFMQRLNETASKTPRQKMEGDWIRQRVQETKNDFEKAMDDDLDVSRALAAVFNLVRDVNRVIDSKSLTDADAELVRTLMNEIERILGVLYEKELVLEEPSVEVRKLVLKREEARQMKDWKVADTIRKRLLKMGFIVEDTPQGPRLRRKRQQ
ncbi:MAG: cysteine--tRNA ligase [Candidatus Bathyarchaeota archaeon]|nr:MAG: cysteine--tRNA ligase [Candidatus Bathyarchaeota archaeon]